MEQEVKGAKKNSMSNDLLEQYENKLNDSCNELFCSKDFQYFDQLLNPLAQPIIKIDEEDSMIKRMRCVTKQCSFKHSTDDNSTLNQCKEDITNLRKRKSAIFISKRNKQDDYSCIKESQKRNFEFSEKNLTSNIKPEIIIRALKKKYGFKKITKATLKHVLYEGARLNRILRINDSCYEKMVDILNIPLDPDNDFRIDEEKSNEINNINSPDRSSAERKSADIFKETFKLRRSGSFDFEHSISDGYTNDFLITKELLRKIIKIETDNIECFKERIATYTNKTNKVAPPNVENKLCVQYMKLYTEYK